MARGALDVRLQQRGAELGEPCEKLGFSHGGVLARACYAQALALLKAIRARSACVTRTARYAMFDQSAQPYGLK
jgi:hypothetical protein